MSFISLALVVLLYYIFIELRRTLVMLYCRVQVSLTMRMQDRLILL